jgi:signal transduction histidine kinase
VTIRSEITGPLRADVDQAALRQVVLNLLDNAVKYGPSGQTIRVGRKVEITPPLPALSQTKRALRL